MVRALASIGIAVAVAVTVAVTHDGSYLWGLW